MQLLHTIFNLDIILQAAGVVENNRPPRSWPDKGCVEFIDYGTRYRPGLDLVLKGIDITINSGEKVSNLICNLI